MTILAAHVENVISKISFKCEYCGKLNSRKRSSYFNKKHHYCDRKCYTGFCVEDCPKEERKLRDDKPWWNNYFLAKYRCANPNNHNWKYYGGKGIKMLLTKEDFQFLWDRDKAKLMKCPSIDRIDSNKDYSLDNCRVIERSENSKRKRTRAIPIGQYTKDGDLIKKFSSSVEAHNQTGIHRTSICNCLNGDSKSAGGFIWRKI